MALLKIKDKDYRNESAIYNLVHYVLNREKMPSGCWGGQGIATDFPAESMYATKKVYGQTN